MSKYDDKTFGKAFAAARKELGAGKTFTWKGKKYTTDYKEEVAKKPAKNSVTRPKPRPTSVEKDAMKGYREGDIKTSTLRSGSGRGDGSAERVRRTADAALSRVPKAQPKAPTEVSYSQWQNMSRQERKAAGLPESLIGGQLAFKRFRAGITGKDYKVTTK